LQEYDVTLGEWLEALRPVSAHLIGPLVTVFRSGSTARDRYVAARVLVRLGQTRPKLIVDLALEAPAAQFTRLWAAFPEIRGEAVPLLRGVLAEPIDAKPKQEAQQRHARAAVILLRLGLPEDTWQLLRHSPDPGMRTFLIHDLGPCGADPQLLIDRFAVDPEISVRRALLLALGDFTEDQFDQGKRREFIERLHVLYRQDPDRGLHAACGWLLRHWGEGAALARVDQALREQPPATGSTPPQWLINRAGITMVRMEAPVEVVVGSSKSERGHELDEPERRVRIERPFLLAATEVTVAQFRRYRPDYRMPPVLGPHDDGPLVGLTWFDAVRYCRWLSDQEGVPEEEMCYPPLAEIKPGMKLPADHVQRTGYRLPAEDEWEYACRAGATTVRFFGDSALPLPHYAWYVHNSDGLTHPVGVLQPNEWGLFDVYGNVWEWMDGWYEGPGSARVLRGGSFAMNALRLRSAERYPSPPENNYPHSGFRIARTAK
jgi:formylglycine-generating enzyme required for sulfatase activity